MLWRAGFAARPLGPGRAAPQKQIQCYSRTTPGTTRIPWHAQIAAARATIAGTAATDAGWLPSPASSTWTSSGSGASAAAPPTPSSPRTWSRTKRIPSPSCWRRSGCGRKARQTPRPGASSPFPRRPGEGSCPPSAGGSARCSPACRTGGPRPMPSRDAPTDGSRPCTQPRSGPGSGSARADYLKILPCSVHLKPGQRNRLNWASSCRNP